MMRLNSLQIIFSCAAVLFALGCHSDKKPKAAGIATKQVKKYTWTTNQLLEYMRVSPADTASVNALTAYGIFRPSDSCTGYYTITPAAAFDETTTEMQLLSAQGSVLDRARYIRDYLYTRVPELYLDNDLHYHVDDSIDTGNFLRLMDRYKRAEAAALCVQYAQLCKLLIDRFDNAPIEPVVKVVSMNKDSGFLLNHTVCLVYLEQKNYCQGIVIDAMYGYLFIGGNKEQNTGYFEHAGLEIRRQKRFLTNRVWPCNLVCDSLARYYQTSPGAISKYELHEPENIRLLNPLFFNYSQYGHDLNRLLQTNAPAL